MERAAENIRMNGWLLLGTELPQASVIYDLKIVAVFVVAWLRMSVNCFLLCIYTCMYGLHVSVIKG